MGGMSSKLSAFFKNFGNGNNTTVVLMLGLDAAGKTTMLYKLKLNEDVTVIPTIGFNVETISVKDGLSLTICDAATNNRHTLPLARHYLPNVKGLIWVVDSKDRERFEEARENINTVLDFAEADGVPMVVLANKQDLPNAAKTSEIADALDLYKLHRRWYIQEMSGLTGEGLYKALEVLGIMCKELTLH